MSTIYNPKSFFITEDPINKLVAPTVNDAFGPVIGSLTSKYRVTSIINGLAGQKIKLFAICDGSIMIFPQKDNTGGLTGKINIVIKPSQMNWEPLKIKYFVYRGVDKEDFFDSNWALNQPSAGSPEILNKMWAFFQTFNMLPTTTGVVFPVESIFQLNTASDTLLDEQFTHSLLNSKAGEHIGNFTGKVGLDIVLDYGDYRIENQEILFNLDVGYASKDEFIFDISTIPSSTTTKLKRYREHIHQFIDAAAFWGSHIDCGEITIKLGNTTTPKKNVSEINPILEKYSTKDKIYIYIQENNRTFNYYNQTRKIYGFNGATGEDYKTSDWPILIKSIPLTNSNTINFAFDYLVNNGIQQSERNISVDAFAPNLKTSVYPITLRPDDANLSSKTSQVPVTFIKPTGGVPCASFAFFSIRVLQKFPVENYFNHLWIANVKSSLNVNPNEYEMYTSTYDKSRNISLDDTIGETAIIQNKVFFDKGRNAAGTTKRRRLYVAVIKNNSNKEAEYVDLNIDNPHSTFIKTISNKLDYFLNLFNRKPDFSIYKGTFTDSTLGSGLAAVVNSLCVFNENSLLNKHSYLFLGITEDEYNLFAVPVGADNIFFDLLEDTTFVSENVRKFKLGLRYEDTTGNINATVYYPSSPIFVYSIDDLFFFSKEFSDYQNYFNEFAKAKVEFRVKLPYSGEFGFDWMRVADTGAPGDVKYEDHVGKLYTNATHANIEMDGNNYGGSFLKNEKMFRKLESEYKFFPVQVNSNNIVERYYVPILTVFPPYITPPLTVPDLDRQSIFTPPYDDDLNRLAKLKLKIKVTSEPIKLELDYDTTKFDINPVNLPKIIGNHTLDISVRCLKEFAKEELIKVKAYYNLLDPIGKMVGVLRVKPNSKSQRFSKKILLINVHTDIDGAGAPPSLIFSLEEQAKFLKKFVRQALSTPIMESVSIDLVANPDPIFNSEFVATSPTGGKYLKDQNTGGKYIIKYLYDYLTTSGPAPVGTTTYSNHFKVFFFNDNGVTGRFGFSLPSLNLLADFTNNLPSTTTHEFLHTANVQHTFANYEGSKYARFTYNPLFTDCIMDYSDFGASPPIPTVSLYDWQSEIAKGNFDIEP